MSSTTLSFGGCIFDDLNGDGIVLAQDANGLYTNTEEPGLSGVTVRVVDASGNEVFFINGNNELVNSVTSDSQGIYRIFGLTEGVDYKLQFDYSNLADSGDRVLSPADVVVQQFVGQGGSDGKDSDAVRSLGNAVVETDLLPAGQGGFAKVNLGLVKEDPAPQTGVIGNQVFEDLNGNGLKDSGEGGVAGVNVTLTGAGADGVLGTADDTTATTTTSDKGTYRFGHLAAGDYKVTFEQPTGFEFTQANAGSDTKDSDADVNTGMTDTISLAEGERNLTIDAGLVRPGSNNDPRNAIIGNQVFEDLNGNGLKDSNEGGVAGVNVTLTGAGADGVLGTADDTTATDITSANGNYRFANLAAGDYKVTFEQPTGFEFTQANAGSDNRDSDADVNTGMTDTISLAASERNLTIDAGLVRPGGNNDPRTGVIGNQVFEDLNGNGLKDGGEGGVAGVNVTLTGAGIDGIFGTADDTTATDTTSANGNYRFGHLAAGDYKVTFDQPDGFEFTQANAGNDSKDSDADVNTGMTDTISLAEGERNLTIDAGLIRSNSAPEATDDSRTTGFETPISINVLGNDSDPDGDPLSVTSIAGQAVNVGQSVDVGNGIATLLANGQIEFNPDAGFTGNESFSYHVSDGNGGEATANVDVIVDPKPNTAPNATDDSRTTGFETPISINVLGNDSDPDGDPLSVTSIAGQAVNVGQSVDVGNGIATLLANGQIEFNPDAGFTGNESFSYHVSDGNGGEATANVDVIVDPKPNTAPNATDDSRTTGFETPISINVLGNDSDPDGDPLSVTSIAGQAVNVGQSVDVGNGIATLLANGQIEFNPDAGFSGNESFSYHVTDGNGGEATANVDVIVDPKPNTAPNATDDSRTTGFETPISINVLGNDSDPDGDPLSVTSIAGQAVNVGQSVDVGNGIATLLANGQIEFNPDAGFTGNESFSYHVSDGNGGEATANVDVIVDPKPNTAPNATDDSRTTGFETPISINVLGNDSDPDGDPLSVTSIAGQAVNVGQSVDVGNGIATLLANGQIEFNPDAGFTGNESFSYHVTDGNGGEATADVDVIVDPKPNTAPNATDDSRTTGFETPISINVLGNDSDPDGDPLSVTSIAGQAVNVGQSVDVGNGIATLLANGQIAFNPDAGFSGNESFSYHVSDGNGGEATANVDVIVEPRPNRAPDANSDSRTTAFNTTINIDVLGNDNDPDGDPLSVTSIAGQAVTVGQSVDVGNGIATLLANGQIAFNPDAGFSGNESFSYHVSDGNGGEDTANVNVTVEPRPNRAPDANNDRSTTAFDTTINIDVLGNDNDPDGDPLSITSIAGQSVTVGQSVDVGNGIATLLANGQIAFNPDANFSGHETFSYHVSDGNGGEDTANVTVTVEPRPRKDIHASIVGAGGIDEGKSGHYKVQLDHAVTEDTVFTLDVHNGSATRVDRNDHQAQNQDIMWGGYYSVGYVDYYGNWTRFAYYVDNRVANGTSLSSGDRPQVGPDGYTTWDYTVEKNGHVQNGGKVNVLVRAGQTMSENFEVQTWKEKVTVDRAPWSVSTGYWEGTENFSIKLTGTSGNDSDDIKLGNNKTVNIFDKTHYAFVSPLSLDLNGDGVQTTALGDTTGTFDLRGDGNAIESGWLSSEDAFLVVDNNGNGTIDDISEMFGGDVGEGFAKLATYDTNGDGLIDESELLGGGLALWRDGNSNHRTDAGELISLGSQGITSIDTAFVETPVYQNGNVLIEHGSATKADGTKVELVDAYFQVADTSGVAIQEPTFS